MVRGWLWGCRINYTESWLWSELGIRLSRGRFHLSTIDTLYNMFFHSKSAGSCLNEKDGFKDKFLVLSLGVRDPWGISTSFEWL
jgi:hypothetical protein